MSTAWLFPGQGSQVVGMGKDVWEASPAAQRVFERADAALSFGLTKLIFEGPEAELTLTENAQPAIVTVSTALLAALRERHEHLHAPQFAAGHSLGEYSALVAMNALTLEDAVRTVRARGKAMQEATPAGVGAMSAIMGIEAAVLEALCKTASTVDSTVSPANYNAPGQIVVAGHAAAVARLGELVSAEKGKAIPLRVSAPFHCALMKPAADVVGAELAKITVQRPAAPIVANVDAAPNSDPDRVKELLVRQVDSPVRWQHSIELMRKEGVTHALEIGPGRVLAGLVKRIDKAIAVHSVSDMNGMEIPAAFHA